MGSNSICPLSRGNIRSDRYIFPRLPCSHSPTVPANRASYSRKGDLRNVESYVIKEVNPGGSHPIDL